MWWRTTIYDKVLNSLTPDEMSRTILYGKVLQKAKPGPCYEVILMNALDEFTIKQLGTFFMVMEVGRRNQLIKRNLFQIKRLVQKDVLVQWMKKVMRILMKIVLNL